MVFVFFEIYGTLRFRWGLGSYGSHESKYPMTNLTVEREEYRLLAQELFAKPPLSFEDYLQAPVRYRVGKLISETATARPKARRLRESDRPARNPFWNF